MFSHSQVDYCSYLKLLVCFLNQQQNIVLNNYFLILSTKYIFSKSQMKLKNFMIFSRKFSSEQKSKLWYFKSFYVLYLFIFFKNIIINNKK
jgi:hypothetical protein